MIKKEIGSAEVRNGVAEYLWDVGEQTTPGKKKLYIAYLESDGYLVSEAWENVYVRIATVTTLNVDNQIITNNPEEDDYITLKANVITRTTQNLVPSGEVQFLINETGEKFVNAGTPVPLTGGVAEYNYVLPELYGTDIQIKAIYLSNNSYVSSVSEESKTVHIRDKLILSSENLIVNRGEEKTISVTATTLTEQAIQTGEIKVYFDDELIQTITNLTETSYTFDYVFSSDLQGGEHTLKLIYAENDVYAETVTINSVYVRNIVHINDSCVYAPQYSIDTNGNQVQGEAIIPLLVEDEYNNIVSEGTIKFICGSFNQTINLTTNTDSYAVYQIPPNTVGGEEIDFNIIYYMNDKYESCEISSKIIVKYATQLVLDSAKGNHGETIPLKVTVVDENGNGVNSGEVRFDLETNE